MPDADVPVIEKWVAHLKMLVGTPDADTYFVGHSIGNQAILRYLETVSHPVGGAVFVAGWFDLKNLEDEETEEIAQPWITVPIDLAKVARVLPHALLLISDNDPFDAYDENVAKFKEIGSEIVTLKNAGHITAASGFTELQEAYDAVVDWGKDSTLSK